MVEAALEVRRDELMRAELHLLRERLPEIDVEMCGAPVLPTLGRLDSHHQILGGGDRRHRGFPLGERTVEPFRVAFEKLLASSNRVGEKKELLVKGNRDSLFAHGQPASAPQTRLEASPRPSV